MLLCPYEGAEMYVNVGARDSIDKMDIMTKKELKAALKDTPGAIELYETTMGKESIHHNGNNLAVGVKYSVVGPNPYTSRKWYATVEKLANGTITVK